MPQRHPRDVMPFSQDLIPRPGRHDV